MSRLVGALVAGLVAGLVLSAWTADPAAANETRPSDPARAEAEFVALLNQERAKAGRAPLQVHPNLVRDARAWSAVMAPQNRWVHTTTLREETARSLPNWTRAGENVGRGWSVRALHDAFVASPTHHANVVGDFHHVGVGVVYTADRTYVTVRFAKVSDPPSTVGGTTAVAPRVSPAVASGQVRRLYLAFFEREPDAAGSGFWVGKLVTGFPLGAISDEFARSPEFRSTYGSLSDGQFVAMVYRNVLGRAPDQAGHSYWVGRMRQGMSRGSVMAHFSESPEFRSQTA